MWPKINVCSKGEDNEGTRTFNYTIGEDASPTSPFENRTFCVFLEYADDGIKEGREVCALTLTSEDGCVQLGRDGALVIEQASGGIL